MGYQKWNDADLSAYLDGQLSPDRARALESALQDDRELYARLHNLKAVVGLMRELPVYEAPRNYILTPSMVAANPKQPVRRYRAPLFMRVATSLTAAAFIVTMGLNVFLNSPASMPLAQMSAPMEATYEATEMLMADSAMDTEAEAPVMMEMAKEAPAEEEVAPMAMTAEIAVEATGEPGDGVADNGALPDEIGIGGGGEPEIGAATVLPEEGEAVAEEETLAPEAARAYTDTVAMPAESVEESTEAITGTMLAEIAPMPTATQTVTVDMPLPQPEQPPVTPARNAPRPYLPGWLPWILGASALVLGVATWVAGRRRR